MKKLLLILLVYNFGFSQASIEIRLVDTNVGAPIYNWSSGAPVPINTSNDAGLNALFSKYGVTNYQDNMPHPYPPYLSRTKVIMGSFPPQFITDLLGYSSVIASAKTSTGFEFTDAVRTQLVNLNVGSPTGVNGGIIVTNDVGLNAIFQTYNVFYYTQTYPSVPAGSYLLKIYDVVCNCDKNLLKTALNGYTSVIQSTQNIDGGLMLSSNQFQKPEPIISPNPFSDHFNIQTDETISNYSLFDISGKQLINRNSKTVLDNVSSQLTSGIYILNLQFDNGQNTNYKIVKK